MGLFSRESSARLLIIAGLLLLALALYDLLRPYLPAGPKPETIFRAGALFSRVSRDGRPPAARPAPATARPRPGLPGGMLTTSIYHNRGHYHGWIWAIRPEKKTSARVKVEIAHAAAGEEGAFQIVAFADTGGDGKPDLEIARSDWLFAPEPGRWSAFEFKTEAEAIFVGNAWPGADQVFIYRGNGRWPLEDSPFADRFFYSFPPATVSSAGPAFTNMRISFPAGNPDAADSPLGGKTP